METRTKRARLCAAPTSPRWLDLESGVWEDVFAHLDSHQLRHARLACKLFCRTASRVVRQLEVGAFVAPDGSTTADLGQLEQQVARLPGEFTCLNTVRLLQTQTYLPVLAPKLATLNCLTHLHVTGGYVCLTSSMIRAICSLSKLRILGLDGCKFEEDGAVEALGDMQQLRRLHITKTYPQDLRLMQAIARLSGLTALALSKPFCFHDHGYSALTGLGGLVDLHIGWSWRLGRGGESLAFLSGLTGLRQLAFTKCFISDEDLRWAAGLTRLESLAVRLCHNVTGTFFGALGGLSALRDVNLDGTYMVTDEGIRCLAGFTGLRSLNLGSSRRVTCSAFDALLGLRSLRELVVPEAMYTRPPARCRNELLPRLTSYQCAPNWMGRIPGRIEEHFQDLLRREAEVMQDPGISTRVLQWFQRMPAEP